jgi:hypothetical protein
MRFSILLEERRNDRVLVSVCLGADEVVHVQGVAVELRSRAGEPLSARLMLPVAGVLHAPLCLHTELRAVGDLPRGAQVIGTAWWQQGQVEASCPTDPGTALEDFARGGSVGLTPRDAAAEVADLAPEERRAWMAAFPWLASMRRLPPAEAPRILDEAPRDVAADHAARHHLSPEDAATLAEILGEDGWDAADDLFDDAEFESIDDERWGERTG